MFRNDIYITIIIKALGHFAPKKLESIFCMISVVYTYILQENYFLQH